MERSMTLRLLLLPLLLAGTLSMAACGPSPAPEEAASPSETSSAAAPDDGVIAREDFEGGELPASATHEADGEDEP